MATPLSEAEKTLPLHDKFQALNARMGVFGQWAVPLYFSSIVEEHEAVRNHAGLFDISHMGKLSLQGKGVLDFLERLLPRRVSDIKEGQALYMPLLNESGGIIDDIILYRQAPERFFFIVNAGNSAADYEWIESHVPSELTLTDESWELGLLALQGPEAAGLVDQLFGAEYAGLRYYHFAPYGRGFISRTGYTGEDGFEILAEKDAVIEVWQQLIEAGRDREVKPVGFGARDTLRLEAGMLLHGHDMDTSKTPLEAGLSWAIDLNKEGFIGREALKEQKSHGVRRRLVAFELLERGIAREGYPILKDSHEAGIVTSGTFSPTLKKNVGLGYVETPVAAGDIIEIRIRSNVAKARIVKRPFYKRNRS